MNKIKKLRLVCYALLTICASSFAPRVDSPQQEFICPTGDFSRLNQLLNDHPGQVYQVLFSVVPGGIEFKTKEMHSPYMFISSTWKLYTAAFGTLDTLNSMIASISKSIEQTKIRGQLCFIAHKSASEEVSFQCYQHANKGHEHESLPFTWVGSLPEDCFRYVLYRLVCDRLPGKKRYFSEESKVLLTFDGSSSYAVELTSSSPKEYRPSRNKPSTTPNKAIFANIKNLRLEPRHLEGVPSYFVSDTCEVTHLQKNRRGKKTWLKFIQELRANFEDNRKWFEATECLYIDSNGVVSAATGMPYKTETFGKTHEELLVKALQERTPVQVWVDNEVHIRFADPTPEAEAQEVQPQAEAPAPQAAAAAAEIPVETPKIVIPPEAFDSGLVVRGEIRDNIDRATGVRPIKGKENDMIIRRNGQWWYVKYDPQTKQGYENDELTEIMYRLQEGQKFTWEGDQGNMRIKEIIDNLNKNAKIKPITLPHEAEKLTKHLILMYCDGELWLRAKKGSRDFKLEWKEE